MYESLKQRHSQQFNGEINWKILGTKLSSQCQPITQQTLKGSTTRKYKTPSRWRVTLSGKKINSYINLGMKVKFFK